MEERRKNKPVPIPFGGIALTAASFVGFYFGSVFKKRAKTLETAPELSLDKVQSEGKEKGYYCFGGSIQPLVKDEILMGPLSKKRTVLYSEYEIKEVKVTTKRRVTTNRRTRNPSHHIQSQDSTKEVKSKPIYTKIPFGLYDFQSKDLVEIVCADNQLDSLCIERRERVPMNSQTNININTQATTGSSEQVIARYNAEKYFPLETLRPNTRPRTNYTIWGSVVDKYGSKVITDKGLTLSKPFVITSMEKGDYIAGQKFVSSLINYASLFVLFLGIGQGAMEVLDGLKEEKDELTL